jgi:hypothetical protein
MKKLLLLVSALFMFGCGLGGGSASVTPGTGTPGTGTPGTSVAPPAGALGSFSIKLIDGNATAAGVGKSVGLVSPNATNARIVVRQIGIVNYPSKQFLNVDTEGTPDVNGPFILVDHFTTAETYKKVYDPTIAGDGTVTFSTPRSFDANDLYTIDVLTYTSGSPNVMLKYGSLSNIQVGTTVVSLVINDICSDLAKPFSDLTKVGRIQFVPPTQNLIKDLNAFVVSATVKSPIKQLFEVTATPNASGVSTGTVTGTLAATLTVPLTNNPADISLRYALKFFISADMLNTGEAYTDWVINDSSMTSNFTPMVAATL